MVEESITLWSKECNIFFHIKSIYFHTIYHLLQKFYDHHEKSEKKDNTTLKSIISKNLKSDINVKMWTNEQSKIQFFQSLIKVAKN